MKQSGMSTREIARRTGRDRGVIAKIWNEYNAFAAQLNEPGADVRAIQAAMTAEPKYPKRERARTKYTAELDERLQKIVASERRKDRQLGEGHKQKLSNKQIHEIVAEEGFDISRGTTDRELARLRRRANEVFIRQSYELGDRLEYDFGEVRLDCGALQTAACPFDKSSGRISLLHSFYCWGHVLVILGSTLFFALFGIGRWKILALLWALVPLANAIYFTRVPIGRVVREDERIPVRKMFSARLFWLFMLLMVCAGAAEQGMSQWVSTFAESSLRVPKTLGDIAGTCMFAAGMGVPRVIYGKYGAKMALRKCMVGGGTLCILCYLAAAFSPYPLLALASCVLCGFSVGTFWPGTFSLASGEFPRSGAAIFAFMAFAGDIGCSLGPALVGAVAKNDFRAGMSAAIVFPAALIVALALYKIHLRKKMRG